jgi:ribosomal protein S18 acetylase RimI-like enzyme
MLSIAPKPLATAMATCRALLPPGVTLRAWRDPSDFVRMADVFHAARLLDKTGWEITADTLEADIRGVGLRPDETILLVESEGELVGWGRVTDFGTAPGDGRMLIHSGHVLPSWRDRGIGRALLCGLQVELLRIREAKPDPPGTPAGLHSWLFAGNAASIEMLEADGYRPFRFMIEMTRPLDALPDAAAAGLPAGLTTRPVTPADTLTVCRAMNEAMRDSHGWPGMDDAQLLEMVDHPTRGQIDVWQVAWAGDRVVGGVLGYIDADENAALGRARGYTEGIFTLRDWRGRGVASALIAANLRLLRERGMTEAALSVDTENPSGALSLYERHGFREHDRVVIYRKELPPAA